MNRPAALLAKSQIYQLVDQLARKARPSFLSSYRLNCWGQYHWRHAVDTSASRPASQWTEQTLIEVAVGQGEETLK